MDYKLHWEQVYQMSKPDEVSWWRPDLEISLQLIEDAATTRDAPIIDVGEGESTLVDDVLALGYRKLHTMGLSATALDIAKARLHANAAQVEWLSGDVRLFAFGHHMYDLWHDRAVLHLLAGASYRATYVRQGARTVNPGSQVIGATFGPDGPTRCSCLEVVRYDPEALHHEFGKAFRLVKRRTELRQASMGTTQHFTDCDCKISA
ncbi:class I SAM-dependent methyltransferase [Gemmatimonas sp.]|uniref:class I SAM-dependent methyltransferase n=1 Tax=Gemmatimonas sp. TaxID=1962908 RepID=UPI003565E59F